MLLEKPDDVKHENSSGTGTCFIVSCAIYGVDAHPSRRLLATAGGDNTVKIWSLEPPEGGGVATFALLATLAFHQQAVNCVRWAGHGRYLASGSDDHLALLYELQEGAPAAVPFGSKASVNKQNWVRCATLERHTMDVEDVAWSPDDRMLATCSIDNSILVWDVGVGRLSEVMTCPLQTLLGHSGWVKGVAWDPVGKYLSSAGEDKTVRMWEVTDWQETDVVTEPFEACASTSHFRRLSWSPDGSVLCATHASNSRKNIAALLNRDTWTNDVKFVGHQSVVTSARFNPKLLVTEADPENEFACCAVGGKDATVSIWLAHLARPLAVVKGCFDASVTDLTWSSAQSLLLACSLDGSICCFQFGGDEIGTPISDSQQSKLLQGKYGPRAGKTSTSILVESPVERQFEENATPSPRSSGSSNSWAGITTTASSTTNTLIPKKKKRLGVETSSMPHNRPPSGASKSNRKRITPVLLQSESESLPATSHPASVHNNIRNILGPTIVSPTAADVAFPSRNGKVVGVAPESRTENGTSLRTAEGAPFKRKRESERSSVMSKSRKGVARPPSESGSDVAIGNQLLPEFPLRLQFSVEIDTSTTSSVSSSSLVPGGNELMASKVAVEVTVQNMRNSQSEETLELGPVHSMVKCSEGSEVKWIDRIPGRAVCVVGNARYCAVGVHNGDLFILSSTGRRLFPCIALGSTISVMECSVNKSPYLLVLLATGELKIWHLSARKLMLSTSIESIIDLTSDDYHALTVLRCQVTAKGMPIVTFVKADSEATASSSLLSFTFDSAMSSWMRVDDDNFASSDLMSAIPTDAVALESMPIGPLRRLRDVSEDNRTQRRVVPEVLPGLSDPLVQRSVTRSHLEHQIAAAIVLTSPTEYLYWVQAYVRFLTHDEDAARLDDLCAELMGPFHASSTPGVAGVTASKLEENGEWVPLVLDLVKRDVLRTHILSVVAPNPTLQLVATKYRLMLSEIDLGEKDEEP